MKQYKVQITDKALADMEEIYNYIAIQLQAPENAIGQYNRIAKAKNVSRKSKIYGIGARTGNGVKAVGGR